MDDLKIMSTWKALSLWEPWGTAIRMGAKTYETRSWSTEYRGDLLICCAKRVIPELHELLSDIRWIGSIGKLTQADLHFGMAVAVARLSGIEFTDYLNHKRPELIADELHLGDFSYGRNAWKLEDIRPIVPVPVKGKQGLFTVEMSADLTWQKDPLTGAEIR